MNMFVRLFRGNKINLTVLQFSELTLFGQLIALTGLEVLIRFQ